MDPKHSCRIFLIKFCPDCAWHLLKRQICRILDSRSCCLFVYFSCTSWMVVVGSWLPVERTAPSRSGTLTISITRTTSGELKIKVNISRNLLVVYIFINVSDPYSFCNGSWSSLKSELGSCSGSSRFLYFAWILNSLSSNLRMNICGFYFFKCFCRNLPIRFQYGSGSVTLIFIL